MAIKTWKYGDTAQRWSFTLTAGGIPVDISGATVEIILSPSAGEPVTVIATVSDGPAGEGYYDPTGSEHSPMTGNAEIKVTFQNQTVKRFPSKGYIKYEIQANLDE